MPAKFRILVVDANPALLDRLSQAAQSVFPEALFVQVHDPAAAQAYFRQLSGFGPKIILLTLEKGEAVDGLELVAFLQASHQTRLIPVIVLTAGQGAYGVGITSFTSKPSGLKEWESYLGDLRHYWHDTVTLPSILFTQPE